MKKTKAKGRTRRPAKERPAPVRDYAKADFKPWEEYEGMWISPDNKEILSIVMAVRLCWRLMFKTKRELMDAVCRGTDEQGKALFDMIPSLRLS